MHHYVTEIKNLVSCPPKLYSQLYLTTLSNFIIHCPAALINRRLQITIAVLKLRRGMLLPKNAATETIAAEEAQWSYALFSACLTKGFELDLIKRIIPDIAETWLQKNNYLFTQWRQVILTAEKNDLEIIITRACEKLNEIILKKTSTPAEAINYFCY